jgi:hypothetical protein
MHEHLALPKNAFLARSQMHHRMAKTAYLQLFGDELATRQLLPHLPPNGLQQKQPQKIQKHPIRLGKRKLFAQNEI